MPHIIIEHSNNIQEQFDAKILLTELHREAMAIAAFPHGGLRLRSFTPDQYCIGDGDPDNTYIYIIVRIGQGRDEDTKKDIGKRLFNVLTSHVSGLCENRPLSLGLEIQEINSDLTWKKNSIHKFLQNKS